MEEPTLGWVYPKTLWPMGRTSAGAGEKSNWKELLWPDCNLQPSAHLGRGLLPMTVTCKWSLFFSQPGGFPFLFSLPALLRSGRAAKANVPQLCIMLYYWVCHIYATMHVRLAWCSPFQVKKFETFLFFSEIQDCLKILTIGFGDLSKGCFRIESMKDRGRGR